MKSIFGTAWYALSVVALLPVTSVSAHHSYAMFDRSEVKLVGTIKEFQWTNPHVWILVEVPNAAGQMVEWGIETGSPNMLKSRGWKAKSIKSGDKVEALVHPKKNGANEGSLIRIVLPDGSILKDRDLVAAPVGGAEGGPPPGLPAP